MTVRAALLLLLLAACSGDSQSTPAGQPAPVAAGTPRHPDPEGAARACLRTHARAVDVNPAERVPFLLRGCKQMFFEVGCQEAHARAETAPPTQRMAIIVAGCGAAYCSLLPAPRPRACEQRGPAGEQEDLFAEWGELQSAILDLELGHERAQKLGEDIAAVQRLAIKPKGRWLPPEPPTRGPIRMVVDQRGVQVDGALVVSAADLAAGKLDALVDRLRAARASPDPPDSVELAVASDQQYALIVSVMDAIKTAGIDSIGLSAK